MRAVATGGMIRECLLVEFRVRGDGCPLADGSRTAEAVIESAPPLLRRDGNVLLRFTTTDAGLGGVLDEDDRIRYLHRSTVGGRDTFRCLAREPCVVHRLIDRGFLAESIRYRAGSERHVGAVAGQDVLEGVMEAAEVAGGVRLERVAPLGEEGGSPVEVLWDLTPAQVAALEAAYGMGYFEVPKRVTAQEVADALGISKSAFLERLRRGQSGLLERVLD